MEEVREKLKVKNNENELIYKNLMNYFFINLIILSNLDITFQ